MEDSSEHYFELGSAQQQSQGPGSHFQLCRWLVAQTLSFQSLSGEWKACNFTVFFSTGF